MVRSSKGEMLVNKHLYRYAKLHLIAMMQRSNYIIRESSVGDVQNSGKAERRLYRFGHLDFASILDAARTSAVYLLKKLHRLVKCIVNETFFLLGQTAL